MSKNSATLSDTSLFQIYYDDTDFSGFVYHANYLKFFERAREHLIGIEKLKSLYSSGIHWVVKRAELDFKAPARFGDEIIVKSELSFSKSPRSSVLQNARLKSGALLVEAHIELVLLNKNNMPMRMPLFLHDLLLSAPKLV